MASRVAAPPPPIPGFEFVSLIGSGGYADVYLYEQAMPNRRVAVKVLDPGVIAGRAGFASFDAEANLMARVSAHPYIVQVFQSDVATDGRPYLVMEYYPGPNFQDRARREQFSVADVLRIGVQLASAVETAHRAGILHRDIKPANVLTSEYRRPGLTDFGIASVQGPDSGVAEGVSIPWSPPEAFGDSSPDRRADVYSLAATLYTLLAGRSPFEVPGGDNRPVALMGRIERVAVPPTGRADVPSSLERVLAGAMAKDPVHRPSTAVEFARQLQAVESELRLAVTALELAEDAPLTRTRVDHDDEATRVKGVVEIRAQDESGSAAITGIPSHPDVTLARHQRPREGMLAEPPVTDTIVRTSQASPPAAEAPATPPRRRPALLIGAVGVVASIAVVVVLAGRSPEPEPEPPGVVEVNDGFDGNEDVVVPPSPVARIDVATDPSGEHRFTWEPVAGDVVYLVTPDGGDSFETGGTEYVGPADCIDVEVVDGSTGLVSATTRGCA